jgi:hypothetical protein
MASAAAVAADQARSPLGNDLGEDEGIPGEVTSGIYPRDEDEEDEDEDLPSNPLQHRGKQRRVNGNVDEEDEEEGNDDDLFGDEEAEEEQQPR